MYRPCCFLNYTLLPGHMQRVLYVVARLTQPLTQWLVFPGKAMAQIGANCLAECFLHRWGMYNNRRQTAFDFDGCTI